MQVKKGLLLMMGPRQKFLTWVKSGQFFVVWIMSGQPSLVWYPLKLPIFQYSPLWVKKYSRQRLVSLLLTAVQKYGQVESGPISTYNATHKKVSWSIKNAAKYKAVSWCGVIIIIPQLSDWKFDIGIQWFNIIIWWAQFKSFSHFNSRNILTLLFLF